MTVETQSLIVVYTADNVAVTFPFTFPVYEEDHLTVYLRDITTLELSLVDPSDYSVTGIGNDTGGSVVFDVAPVSGNSVVITRQVDITQNLELLNQTGFYPENVEANFDLQTMVDQQIDEKTNRSVRGQLNEEWPDLPPAPDRAGLLLGFTDDANAFPTTSGIIPILVGLLESILSPGSGITIGSDGVSTITITNSAPGIEQDCWLLEDATGGGGGGVGDAEFIRDTVFAALIGSGVTITQDDPGDTITLTVTGSVGLEDVYDAIAAAVTQGTGLIIVDSDPGNTTTISADPEFIRNTIGTALVQGVGIQISVDDAGNTITIRSVPNILTVVSSATVTPTFSYDQVNITAQAANLTLANPTGTAIDGHGILIRIKDNGTSRTIAYGTKYRTFSDALPAATVINKQLYIGIVYNEADDKWDVLGVRKEA
jgi:hypothetical protein